MSLKSLSPNYLWKVTDNSRFCTAICIGEHISSYCTWKNIKHAYNNGMSFLNARKWVASSTWIYIFVVTKGSSQDPSPFCALCCTWRAWSSSHVPTSITHQMEGAWLWPSGHDWDEPLPILQLHLFLCHSHPMTPVLALHSVFSSPLESPGQHYPISLQLNLSNRSRRQQHVSEFPFEVAQLLFKLQMETLVLCRSKGLQFNLYR